jgi:hypothetical protein
MPNHKLTTSTSRWQMTLRVAVEVAALYLLYLMFAELGSVIGIIPTVLYVLSVALILLAAVYATKERSRKRRRAAVQRGRQNA